MGIAGAIVPPWKSTAYAAEGTRRNAASSVKACANSHTPLPYTGPDQILEIILQMAVSAGFPAALEAVRTAASVFGEAHEVTHGYRCRFQN